MIRCLLGTPCHDLLMNLPMLFGAGDILTVQGNRETNKVSCTNCKSELTFLNDERSLVLSGEPPAAKPKPGKKPAKQAA